MTEERRATIAEHLAKLYSTHGQLTPSLVVQDAKNAKSPIHDEFEWDDKKAGQSWREDQARTLIRSVRVLITTDTVQIRSVAYVRNPDAKSDEQGYISVEKLRADPRMAREALTYACTGAASLMERARDLALVLGLANEIDAVIDGIAHIQEKAVA